MVVIAKKSGKHRRMVDLSPLNKHCLREIHFAEIPFFQVSMMKKNAYKSMVDAWNGYCRAPLGHVCSGNVYTHRADNITKDMQRQCKVVNNMLLFDDDITSILPPTFEYLKLCRDNGVTFN